MLNILDLGFLSVAITVAFTGFVINHYEKHVPAFIIKGFKYGSFAYQGSGANYLQIIEVPKALYRHFYAFSSVFSSVTLIYALLVYCWEFSVHRYIVIILKVILEQDEPAVSATASLWALSLITLQCIRRCYETFYLQVFASSSKMNLSHYIAGIVHYFAVVVAAIGQAPLFCVSATASLWALSLITLQCIRRCYETFYLQVFASSSKMNLSHYIAGIVHYFAVVVAAIGQAPLFCGNQDRNKMIWSDTKTFVLLVPCTLIYLWAWYEQYKSNIIFANLRKDKKSGEVVTEEHKIPHGRLFKHVSSPHRMCEVILYVILLLIVPTRTFFCIFLWVICNQVQTAIHAHVWYKKTFKDYPNNRMAIVPNLL